MQENKEPDYGSYLGLTPDFFQKLVAVTNPHVTINSIEVSAGSGRGDNYTSQLYRVKASGLFSLTAKWSRSFICKILPVNQARRDAFKSESLFKNEVAFYTHALPALVKFQESKGPKIFHETPLVYLAEPNMIVLEDLREKGYIMIDRKKPLDKAHCRAILETLGHLHGVSLAFKSSEPELFSHEVTSQVSECLFKKENEEWYKDYYQRAGKNALQMIRDNLADSNNSSEYLARFESFIGEDFFHRMVEAMRAVEPAAVLCHGDCWTNNFLFRYNDDGSISSLRMVDFQFVRYGSPALDLVYLLFNCTDRDMRRGQLAELLRTYCDSLHNTLTSLHCCPRLIFNDVPLLQVIEKEMDLCSSVGLGFAIEMIPICVCDSEQAPDLYNQDCNSPDNIEQEKNNQQTITSASNTQVCRRRITDLVVDLVDKDII